MLGPLSISRQGTPMALPASRKVRALFGYLALAPRPVARSHLCELLWDVPNDPRGELRWCLSKIRGFIDTPDRHRVYSRADSVGLDLSDCFVDALEVAAAIGGGIASSSAARQRELEALFGGDLLEGLEIDRNPDFEGWLTAQRRRFRGCHTALLEQLASGAPDDDVSGYLEKWLQLVPFDLRVHETVLGALARQGRIREGEEHLAAAARQFEAEGIDWSRLRDTWSAIRTREADATGARPGQAAVIEAAGGVPGTVAMPSSRRASLAVMPFADLSAAAGVRGHTADALAHDVITRLAKLRSMFVIAQGTVFALHDRGVGAEEAGRMLNVDYVLGGSVRRQDQRLVVTVELVESRTARIVWAEVFNRALDDAFAVLDEIGDSIVASIASEIETIERNRAILKPPNSLDAWEAHHRGLWHMYRFSREENDRARHFFESAVRLDPTFARAYAGLSFTHFQNAFQGWTKPEPEIERAYATAGQSLMVDDRDPAAHWAMGRALWLRRRPDQALLELQQAVELSPNFALGHYTLAFMQSQSGDANAAIACAEHSRRLSPYDPLLFGMLGSLAMAHVRLGHFEEAAEWGAKAAARPNAHPHILAIATFSLALAGSLDAAQTQATALRKMMPAYDVEDFFGAFKFDPAGAALFRKGASRVGMA